MTPYFHLHMTGVDACSMDDSAYAQASQSWLCPGCRQPRPGTAALDVRLQEPPPRRSPMSLVFGCGVGVARRGLLAALGAGEAELHLGKVLGPSGEDIVDWATFRGRRRVVVRGSKDVAHRTCSTCGQTVYFARGARYLHPRPDPGASVLESHLWGLVVTAEVMQRLDVKAWRGLGVEGLEVAASPRDGLGADLHSPAEASGVITQ